MSKRVQFLRSFLGALGAKEVVISRVSDATVDGTVIYDPLDRLDRGERQDFRWHVTETSVPATSVFQLAELLHVRNLLDIDRITISQDELRTRFNAYHDATLDHAAFRRTLGALGSVCVRAVDDGKESDVLFIHE